jgi:hypothetical protein
MQAPQMITDFNQRKSAFGDQRHQRANTACGVGRNRTRITLMLPVLLTSANAAQRSRTASTADNHMFFNQQKDYHS